MQICKLGAAGKIGADEVRDKLDKILSEVPVTAAQTNWLTTIDKGTVTSSELASLVLPRRRLWNHLCPPWCRQNVARTNDR